MKYLCNVFHALKIVFANEAGSVLKAYGLDGREVMKIFCQDTQLNISAAYMRPGFAFGGSCLPKEVKGFVTLARERDVQIPALGGLLDSNEMHIKRAYDLIARDGRKRVAFFGLAFKPGTDDMRDSPLVTLAERLLGKGFEMAIFDRFVKLSRLLGKNKEFIDREIPHLERLLRDDAACRRCTMRRSSSSAMPMRRRGRSSPNTPRAAASSTCRAMPICATPVRPPTRASAGERRAVAQAASPGIRLTSLPVPQRRWREDPHHQHPARNEGWCVRDHAAFARQCGANPALANPAGRRL